MNVNNNSSDSPDTSVSGDAIETVSEGNISETHRGGERKTVTALFADIKGSTALIQDLDAEDATNLLSTFVMAMTEAVRQFEGTVVKELGDGIMAVFGAPISQADHAVRACMAALAMQESARNIARRMQPKENLDIRIRVGLNSGTAIVITSEDATQTLIDVTGPVVALASRMESTADPGTVNLSENCYHRVENKFDCEPLGPRIVKGFSDPVPVYALIRQKDQRLDSLQEGGLDGVAPLVGRDHELAALTDCMDRLVAGQGSIIFVNGDPGIGKTRLIQELRRQPAPGTVQWLEGRSLSYGNRLSYWPFMELIKQYLDIRDTDTDTECWDKLEGRVWSMFGKESDEILPYIATLLRFQIKPELVERVLHLGGESLGQQVMRASRKFFERVCEDRPTVLVFEDIHWMDGSSAKLLEHLYALIEIAPLTVIVLSRKDEGGPTDECRRAAKEKLSSAYINIDLNPLAAEASLALAESRLADDPRTTRLRDMILYKSDGNPFFVEEVIRALASEKIIKQETATGKWSAAAYLDEILIPDTIHDVIMARIDQIDDDLKELLGIASVIGRTFLYQVLKSITEEGYKIDESLSGLRLKELIDERNSDAEREYIFKHALVHDAVYGSLLRRRRRDLHRAVGNFLENTFKDRLEEFCGLMAFHFSRAEMWEKAQKYLFAAGDQASHLAADDEVLLHYEEAVLAYKHAFGQNLDDVQNAIIERKLGETHVRRGNDSQALEHFRKSLQHLNETYPSTNFNFYLTLFGQVAQHAIHGLNPSTWTKIPKNLVSDRDEARIRLCDSIGWLHFTLDPNRMLLDMVRGLNWSTKAGFPDGMAYGFSGIGFLLDFFGVSRLARRYHERSIKLAKTSMQPATESRSIMFMGSHQFFAADFSGAHAHLSRSREISRRVGDLDVWANASKLQQLILCIEGKFEKALSIADEMVEIGRDAAFQGALRWGMAGQGECLNLMGQIIDGCDKLEEAVELSRDARDYLNLTGASAELGFCQIRNGDVKRAIEVLEFAQDVIVKHRVIGPTVPMVATRLAEAYLSQMETNGAADRRKAKWACRLALKRSKFYKGFLPRAMRLSGTFCWIGNDRSKALEWWSQSIDLAERFGAKYDLALTYAEIGVRTDKRQDVEKARTIFGEIGAVSDEATLSSYGAQFR